MTVDKSKLDQSRGYWEGPAAAALDRETADLAATYKKEVCKNYISINPGQIDDKLGGASYYVTRKYDGELAVLFWNGEDCFSVNSGGTVRLGLPCLEEAAACFRAAGLKQAVIPSELYVEEEKARSRVFEVLAALADKSLHTTLRLALFDIVLLDDGAAFRPASYGDIHRRLGELCGKSALLGPVRMENAASRAEVKDLFEKWVNEEEGEGLVVRSELPMIYKIKNRHTLDAAVIGFSEGAGDARGQVRTLLLALQDEGGIFQIIGRCGNGLGEDLKKELFPRLLEMKIDSKYIETDSNHVAFHMIRPEIVVEIHINDILFETSSGPILNHRLELKAGTPGSQGTQTYHRCGTVPGLSVVFPIFSRFREDKRVNPVDVRLAQADEINYNPYADRAAAPEELAPSKLIKREVYKKNLGAKLMIQKFLVWKTNKEKTGPGASYPAYVLAYTNFSSDRAEPLQSEARVSDSEKQILALCAELMDKNLKKGWERAAGT
ncbi:MAG: hypothetical protein LBD09_03280 [Treponema sp.]|jgi:hypothetical protein|nr:hypothetical protein [Treponema sp.]